MRADIVTARAAVAHAAWRGPYRGDPRRHPRGRPARAAAPPPPQPFDAPGLDEDLLDDAPRRRRPRPRTRPRSRAGGPARRHRARRRPAGRRRPPALRRRGRPTPATRTGPNRQARPPVDGHRGGRARTAPGCSPVATAPATGEAGRRSRARTPHGPCRRAAPAHAGDGRLHLPGTVTAAAPHSSPRAADRRSRPRARARRPAPAPARAASPTWCCSCVDASGSMAARRRMEQVKTAVLSLLLDAYQRRDKVGTGHLPPAHRRGRRCRRPRSVDVAARRLAELPAGGRTPLAEGLHAAARCCAGSALRDPRRRPLLVVVTDGRATSGPDAAGSCPTAPPPRSPPAVSRSSSWTARPDDSGSAWPPELADSSAGRARAARRSDRRRARRGRSHGDRSAGGGCA